MRVMTCSRAFLDGATSLRLHAASTEGALQEQAKAFDLPRPIQCS